MKEYIKNNVWEKRFKTRTDLSKFLVHLTKPAENISNIKKNLLDKNDILELQDAIYKSSVDVLINILNDEMIKGYNTIDIKGNIPVVCFQDTSFSTIKDMEKDLLEEYVHTKKLRYCGVGLSFDKSYLYKKDTKPVIYDNKNDFSKERLKKYTHLSPIPIKNKIKSNKSIITIHEDNHYIQIIYIINNINLNFIEKLDILSRNLYNNYSINKIKEIINEIMNSLNYDINRLNKLKENLEDSLKQSFENSLEGRIHTTLIKDQTDILNKLKQFISKNYCIDEFKYLILEELNEYMIKRCNELDETDFIWRLVELNLDDNPKSNSTDFNIVDFTFEREWRKKYFLKFNLDNFKNKSEDMVLIFPNKIIYEYFINKLYNFPKLKSLQYITKYNVLNNNQGITYVILEDYIDSKSIDLNNTLLESLTNSFEENGLINNEILNLLNSYKII